MTSPPWFRDSTLAACPTHQPKVTKRAWSAAQSGPVQADALIEAPAFFGSTAAFAGRAGLGGAFSFLTQLRGFAHRGPALPWRLRPIPDQMGQIRAS